MSGPLPAGKYVIAYRIVSSDGHPKTGEVPFTVLAAETPSESPSPEPSETAAASAPATPEPTPVATADGGRRSAEQRRRRRFRWWQRVPHPGDRRRRGRGGRRGHGDETETEQGRLTSGPATIDAFSDGHQDGVVAGARLCRRKPPGREVAGRSGGACGRRRGGGIVPFLRWLGGLALLVPSEPADNVHRVASLCPTFIPVTLCTIRVTPGECFAPEVLFTGFTPEGWI